MFFRILRRWLCEDSCQIQVMHRCCALCVYPLHIFIQSVRQNLYLRKIFIMLSSVKFESPTRSFYTSGTLEKILLVQKTDALWQKQ